MPRRITLYVLTVASLAALVAFMLWRITWHSETTYVPAAAAFSFIGLIAQLMAHSSRTNALGSIAFLPFLAAVTVQPSIHTVMLVVCAMTICELRAKKSNVKRIFNVSQYALATGAAALAFISLGGESVVAVQRFQVLPQVASVLLFLAINSTLVAGVIALSTGRGVVDVLRQQHSSFAYDLFAVPMVYWCALFYVKLGWAGMAFGFVALLGARQLYMKNRLLETAYEETLEILVGAVELRDPYTSGHSQRVRKYSQIIAAALELPVKEIEKIGRAALLHDVGKIDGMFVPILQKPGKLTEEERAIMELHPIKSAELVSKASQLADIVDIVRHHHENWDGTGYPAQLKGEAIPLGSRIIMFADTIDAMTSDRPYRKALGETEVRSELVKFSGKQFDPNICEKLIHSTQFARIFDSSDSGKIQSVTQLLDRVRRRPIKPAAVA